MLNRCSSWRSQFCRNIWTKMPSSAGASVQHLVSFEEEWRKPVNSSCILQLRPSTLWSDLHPVFTMWAPMEEISSSKSLDGLESVKMWTEDPATGIQVFNKRGRCEAWFFPVSIVFDKFVLLFSFGRKINLVSYLMANFVTNTKQERIRDFRWWYFF